MFKKKTTETTEDSRIYMLAEEKPSKAVLQMGIPIVAGLLVMGLYNLVDTFFIGLLHDDYQLGAVSLAYPIMMIDIAISNMIGTGAASFMARCLGAKNLDKAQRTLTVGMILTVIFAALLTFFGLEFLPGIVTLLGAKENTYDFTMEYTRVILIGSIFTMGSYTLGQLLRSEGSAKQAMVGSLAGTITNLVLDPVFIFVFQMGIRGAAIATVIGNAVGTLIPLYYYLSKKSLLYPSLKLWKPTGEILREIFWVGVPATLETLLMSAAFIVNNNLAVAYGELTVTAMGVSQKIISIGSNIYQGFAAGNQPLMGYNYGARNYTRMRSVLKAGVIAVTVTELGVMAIYGVFAPLLIKIFSQTPAVVTIGARVLRANMFALLFVGSVSMSRTTFQAMGKPLQAFVITVVRQGVLYVPLLLLLNRSFGFGGMIWAQPIAECIMMAASLLLLRGSLRKLETRTAPDMLDVEGE